jgi:ABC-type lipoprotein release transport system permease subunit
MIFTTTTSILSGLRSAPAAFAGGEGFVISDTNAPTIFSSRISVDMVPLLEGQKNITGASAEIFSFSSWSGHSFVLRGVDLVSLNKTGPQFSKFELTPHGSTSEFDSALVGARLLDRLGIQLPFTIPVVGSYSFKVQFLKIVGWFQSDSPLDDELLISLGAARQLTGMADGEASIIRVSTSHPDWLTNLLSPKAARFALFDLHTSAAQVAKGEPLTVQVGIRNWGSKAGIVNVTFSEQDREIGWSSVALNASVSKTIAKDFVSDAIGAHSIRVSIGGEFPVKLFANYSVVEPYLTLAAPAIVTLGSSFNVTAKLFNGLPAPSASLSFDSQTAMADSEGRATFAANSVGSFAVNATLSGYSPGSAMVSVVDPATLPDAFVPRIASASFAPVEIKTSESVSGVVVVENDGTLAGMFNVVVYVDNQPSMTMAINLSGLSSETLSFNVGSLAAGIRTLQVGSFAAQVVVQPWIADNPDLVQLVIRYSGSGSLSSSSSIPIYQAAKISQGNVAVALFAIGAISALLAVLAVTSVFSKELREGRRRLGVLKTIGASGSAIRGMVFPQALENALAGAAIGIALGIIAADQLSRSGVFFLFGHEFSLDMNTSLLILVLFGSVVISVLSALVSATIAGRGSAIRSIRMLEDESGEQPRIDELLDD